MKKYCLLFIALLFLVGCSMQPSRLNGKYVAVSNGTVYDTISLTFLSNGRAFINFKDESGWVSYEGRNKCYTISEDGVTLVLRLGKDKNLYVVRDNLGIPSRGVYFKQDLLNKTAIDSL